MRAKNKADMTVTEQIASVSEKICNGYCKYPQIYREKYLHGQYENADEATERMIEECCNHCPLLEL